MRDGGVTWPVIRGRILSCVEACDALVVVSEDCAEACLALSGDGVITGCFIAALDCAEVWTITDPEHVSAAKTLRVRFQTPTSEEAAESLERDLADYDAAFGVSFEQGEEVA